MNYELTERSQMGKSEVRRMKSENGGTKPIFVCDVPICWNEPNFYRLMRTNPSERSQFVPPAAHIFTERSQFACPLPAACFFTERTQLFDRTLTNRVNAVSFQFSGCTSDNRRLWYYLHWKDGSFRTHLEFACDDLALYEPWGFFRLITLCLLAAVWRSS